VTVADLQTGDYTISCDRARLDVASIHACLAASYWSPGISREVVERGIEYSLPFGVYRGAEQVGFARVVTDRATFGFNPLHDAARIMEKLQALPYRSA
jgi:hypothetical protein